MKIFALGIVFISALGFAQKRADHKILSQTQLVKSVDNLTLDAAMELAKRSTQKADALEKNLD